MEIALAGRIVLYIVISILGLLAIVVFGWQIVVLRGKSMKCADGTFDDWHEQKMFYGIALADVTLAVPVTLAGIILIFTGWRVGYYLTGLASFWFLWANIMTTATSLRFESPKLSIGWFIAFPFGAIVALAYIIWSLIYFQEIF